MFWIYNGYQEIFPKSQASTSDHESVTQSKNEDGGSDTETAQSDFQTNKQTNKK